MASSFSSKLTHLVLAILSVTIFVVSAQASLPAIRICTMKGYIQNPLSLSPNGASTITKTLYMTKTPDQDSDVLGKWDLLLTPESGDWKKNMAVVLGVVTPNKTATWNGYGCKRLTSLKIEGWFDGNDGYGMFVVGSFNTRKYQVKYQVDQLGADNENDVDVTVGVANLLIEISGTVDSGSATLVASLNGLADQD